MSTLAIFLCVVLAIPSELQAQDIVTKACDRALYKDVCRSSLASAPNKADKKSVCEFALNLTKTIGNHIKTQIGSSPDPAAKKAEADCSTNYSNAMDCIKEAQTAAAAEQYNDVNTQVSAAMTAADTCETGFSETSAKSPLTELNTMFTQLCSTVLAITNA